MSASDSVPPPLASDAAATTYSYRKEIVSAKIAQMNESRSELQTRIQSLKQDLQSWRLKLDTQVKIYRDKLSQVKASLNVEVEQLRSEFQELRTTLQQQQDDVAASLSNLGLQDMSTDDNAIIGFNQATASWVTAVLIPKTMTSIWCFEVMDRISICFKRMDIFLQRILCKNWYLVSFYLHLLDHK